MVVVGPEGEGVEEEVVHPSGGGGAWNKTLTSISLEWNSMINMQTSDYD